MPKIVPMEIGESGRLAGRNPRRVRSMHCDFLARGFRRENAVIRQTPHLGAGLKQCEGFAHQRYRPAFAVLRFV